MIGTICLTFPSHCFRDTPRNASDYWIVRWLLNRAARCADPVADDGGLTVLCRTHARQRSPKIPLQYPAIDFRQFLKVGDRRALVDLVHGLAHQAELDHRTIARDKARIRGAA
jgi:hypothetical protein